MLEAAAMAHLCNFSSRDWAVKLLGFADLASPAEMASCRFSISKSKMEVANVSQCLRALPVPDEDSSVLPSAHTVAYNYL